MRREYSRVVSEKFSSCVYVEVGYGRGGEMSTLDQEQSDSSDFDVDADVMPSLEIIAEVFFGQYAKDASVSAMTIRREQLEAILDFNCAYAAVTIQRMARGWILRLKNRRRKAASRIRSVIRGFKARESVARAAEAVSLARRKAALQGEQRTTTRAAPPTPSSHALAAGAPPVNRLQRQLHATRKLQLWFKRSLPVRRARKRAKRVAAVVRAAIDIQRCWKGYRQRRKIQEYLRLKRWQRQVRELDTLLRTASITDEARRMNALVEMMLDGDAPGFDPNDEAANIDPVADARYFRGLRSMPKTAPVTSQRNARNSAATMWLTRSLPFVSKIADAEDAAFEASLKASTRRPQSKSAMGTIKSLPPSKSDRRFRPATAGRL